MPGSWELLSKLAVTITIVNIITMIIINNAADITHLVRNESSLKTLGT